MLLHVPVGWLLPIGRWLGYPSQSRLGQVAVVLATLVTCFGVYRNWRPFLLDIDALTEPLTLVQTLFISMFSVSLLGQVVRVAACQRATGVLPPFGVALIFSLIPRFFVDMSSLRGSATREVHRIMAHSAIWGTWAVFAIFGISWLLLKDTPTILPALLAGLTGLSLFRSVRMMNPLAKRTGYFLIAMRLGNPRLREDAFASLIGGRPRRFQQGIRSIWGLRLYGLICVLYLVAVFLFISLYVGGWLVTHWGGFGIVVFLGLVLTYVTDPLARRAPNDAQQTAEGAKWKPLRIAGAAVVLLFLIVAALQPFTYEPGGPFELLPGKRMDARALIEGRVEEIRVGEGDVVEEGQVLAILSDDEERRNLDVLVARIDAQQANMDLLLHGATDEMLRLAEQKIETARVRLHYSEKNFERVSRLSLHSALSRAEYEKALAQRNVDAATLAESVRALDLVREPARAEELDALRAEIARDQARLDYVKTRLGYAQIRAGMAGRVVAGSLQYGVGDYLDEGDWLATIESAESMIAEVRIGESDIAVFEVGAPAQLRLLAFPEAELRGRVSAIAPVAEPDGLDGLQQIVLVKVEFEAPSFPLRPLMTGYAKIAGPELPFLSVVGRHVWRFASIEFWSWLP